MSSLVPGCLYIAAPVYIILYRIPAFLGNVLIYGARGEIPAWFSFSAGPQKTVFLRVLHWPTQSRGLSEIQKLWFGISSALVNLIFWPYSLWLWDTMCNTTRNLWVTASHLHAFFNNWGAFCESWEANNLLWSGHKYLLAEIWNFWSSGREMTVRPCWDISEHT